MHSSSLRLRAAAAALTVGFGVLACSSTGGGTCSTAPSPTPYDPGPALTLGARYVARSINGIPLPVKVTDAKGDSIRVYADTLYFSLTDTTFVQATRAGRFVGFPAESISVERLSASKFTLTPYSATLSVVIGGSAQVAPYATELQLTVRRAGVFNGYWYYDPR